MPEPRGRFELLQDVVQKKGAVAEAFDNGRKALRERNFVDTLKWSNHTYTYALHELDLGTEGEVFTRSLDLHRDLATRMTDELLMTDPYMIMSRDVMFPEINHMRELFSLREQIHVAVLRGTLGPRGKLFVDPFAILPPDIYRDFIERPGE